MSTPVWDHNPTPPIYSPVVGDARVDAVVVGLGGSGLEAVRRFAERGCSVIGIDAATVGGGAAGRNGGFLLGGLALFHHDAVERLGRNRAADAYAATLDEINRMALADPDLVRRTGSLRLAADANEERDCERHLAALEADGIQAEPYAGPDGVGLLIGDDAAVQPLTRCRALAARLHTAAGVALHEQTEARSIVSGNVTTATGVLRCRYVVVAVDGGLEHVVPSLVGRLRSTRLQMLATAPTSDVAAPRPVYHRWGFDYWHQLPTGEIALGGGRDVDAEAEWGAPPTPSTKVQGHLDAVLRDVIGTAAEVTHRWAGSVGYTDNRLPIIEMVAPGVAAAGGPGRFSPWSLPGSG